MKPDKFEKEYKSQSSMIRSDIYQIIEDSLAELPRNKAGTLNLVIASEELNEASKEICKWLRRGQKGNRLHLIEELADAWLSIQYVMRVANISDAELNKAINTKLERQNRRNKED